MYRRTWLAIAAIGLAVAGCGGGDDTAAIETVATEFQFAPAVWNVPEGAEVTLTLDNQGTEDHEWALLSGEIEAEAEFTEDLVIWEIEAAPGESVEGTFTAPAAGSYQVVCVIPGHFDSGMEGVLTVGG